MHITILALGSTGDILPYAALGHHLSSQGFEVLFVTTENYRNLIARHDIDFLEIPGDARAVLRSNGDTIFSLFRSFAELSRELTRILTPDNHKLNRTDLILNQLPVGLYGRDFAEKLGIPTIQAAVIPLTPTGSFPMMGWPLAASRNRSYNRLSFRIYEKMTQLYMRGTVNQWRSKTLDLPKTGLRQSNGGSSPNQDGVIYGFSRHILKKPSDWQENVHICGYWFLDDSGWNPPEELRAFIEGGDPPIFIGFGSMPSPEPTETTNLIIKAFQKSGCRAVLHAGWADLGGVQLPDNIFLIDFAPYQWLFPRMAAVVHHGGSGTTGRALWSGVPSVAVPFLFDQSFWGNRIAAVGVGPEPIPFKKLTVERLSVAIESMLNDSVMRVNAAELGRKVKAESGVQEAEYLIRDLLDKP